MKRATEFDAFKNLLNRILTVRTSCEVVGREAEYNAKAALNRTRRGPKPKQKRRTS